jgi:2-oxoglutarate ferredoxin oxidoreductase subunit alpha
VRLAPGTLEVHNLNLLKKYNEIEEAETRYELTATDDADVILVAYGTAARVAKSAVSMGRETGEIKLGLIRPVTLWPFPAKAVDEIGRDKQTVLVVEMSLGQMYEDVLLSVCGGAQVSLLGHTGGGLPTEQEIIETAKKARASGKPIKVFPGVSQ